MVTAAIPLIRDEDHASPLVTSTIRVLVFDPESDQRAALAAELQRSGHEAVIAEDVDAACRALAHKRVDISLIGVRNDEVSALRALRQASKSTYIIAVGHEISDHDVDAIYDAGADSDIRGPTDSRRVIGRVRAALRRWNRSPIGSEAAAEPFADEPNDNLLGSVAWRNAAALIQIATSQTLALAVAVGNPARIRAPLAQGSMIELTSARYRTELRIALAADQRSAQAIATHVLGSEDDAAIMDVMNELANVFMGAIKTALTDEAIEFTSGIPAAHQGPLPVDPDATHQCTFALFVHDARVAVRLMLCPIANGFVPVGELQEGMVLAQPVYSPRGVLLLEAGTRLSEHMLGQLGNALAQATNVEVMLP
jgi:DNA-binding response OmpR family regulator